MIWSKVTDLLGLLCPRWLHADELKKGKFQWKEVYMIASFMCIVKAERN